MIKNFLFGIMTLSLFLFFSCSSTKQVVQNEESQKLEEVIAEEKAGPEDENTSGQEEISSEEAAPEEKTAEVEAAASENLAESIDSLYPILEEIEEEEIIDLPYEEPVKIESEEKEETKEAEFAELAEPVPESEILPPLEEKENADELSAVGETVYTDPETEAAISGIESESTDPASAVPEPVEGQEDDSLSFEPQIQIQEEAEEIVIIPSRSVSLKKGETLVITYPGQGWIYMGTTSEYNNLASRGRKLGTGDTTYTLLAKEEGTQIHHFYKVDNLSGQYIDDYIEVTVLNKKGNSATVVNAPDYKEVVPKKPESPAKSSAGTEENQKAVEIQKPAQAVEAAESVEAADSTEEEDSVIVIDDDGVLLVSGEEDDSDQMEEDIIRRKTLLDSIPSYSDSRQEKFTDQKIPSVEGMPIESLQLSARAYNGLSRIGCSTIGDVCNVVKSGKLTSVRNLGKKSQREILDSIWAETGEDFRKMYRVNT